MKKRFNIGIVASLCVSLMVSLWPASAAEIKSRSNVRSDAAAIKEARGKKAIPAAYGKATLREKAGKPQSPPEGQTQTLLPDGRLLVIGGEGVDGPQASAEINEPRTNEVTLLSSTLQSARAWHSATMLPDGKVLIVGGVGRDGKLVETAELFDPTAQRFDPLPATSLMPRAHHTATLLTDGRVLIAGGLSKNGKAINKIELWDSQTGLVETLSVKLLTARYGHTATLLANGNVLLWGGFNNAGTQLQNGEMFIAGDREKDAAGNQLVSHAARVVAVDALPESPSSDTPHLAASLPENGAVNVALDSRIALRFSKALRVETVNATTVRLASSDGTITAKIVPAEGGMLAFVTPDAPLLPATLYTLSLNGATDSTGLLLEPVSMQFVTAEDERPRGRVWVPGDAALNGDWSSHYPHSTWQDLPPYQGSEGVTALSGQVLRLDGWPLENVKLRIGAQTATTDQTGRFILTGVEAGRGTMIVDCRPASTRKETYGFFMIAVDVPKSNETNVLPYTIWMPLLDTRHAIRIPSPIKKEIVAVTPLLPGLEVHIPPKTVLRDVDGQGVSSITITPIPLDRGPFPGPVGVKFPMFFTLQLGGTTVRAVDGTLSAGMRLVFPNYGKVPAGTRIDFWSYAADGVGWYTYGKGTVTADSKQIVPDAGVTIHLFTCASIGSPNEPDGPPPCNGCAKDGDPVDLSTGLFVYQQTDLVLPDIIPISLTRVYRPNDPKWRPFGTGTRHPYEMFLVGDQTSFSYIQLILPDGGNVRFDRISPGTGLDNAILQATTTPTSFYNATLTYYPGRWDLKTRDGMIYRFSVDFREVAPLAAIIDRNGNQLTIQRTNDFTGDLQGHRITRLVTPNGRWVELTYDANFHITQAKDNIGRIVSYAYDTSGRLTQVTDANGGVTQYTYDAANRMLTIRDARNIVYLTNEYDTNGRVTKQTQADATTYQFSYTLDGNGNVTQTNVTDPRGHIRQVTFNGDGYVLSDSRTCCGGQSYTFERQTGTDFVTNVTDPLNRRTSYAYDTMGNVTSITQLAGTAEAVTTNFTYDPAFNQVAAMTDPLNHTATYSYDSRGNLTSITDPLNHQTTASYNVAGQLMSATDALGNTTQFNYDGADLVQLTSPLGRSTTRFVDGGGRLARLSNSMGSTRYEYDKLNRPTKITDPLQGATAFSYDPNGNLLTVGDARNNVTNYTYDDMDHVATRTDPLLRQDSYIYDANGNLHQVTDHKSQVTSYTYDSLDRLTLLTYQDASTTSYSYDMVNRLTQVADSVSGTISYTYDNLDRVLSETTPLGTVSYTYDAIGRRTSMMVPGQNIVNYIYDSANRLTQIQQGTATVMIAYDAADRRTSVTLPNAVVMAYSYDAGSRLTGISYAKGAATLGNLTYEYDAAGRIVKSGGSFARTTLPQAVSTTSYNAANQQTGFGAQTLTYDLNGNLTSDGTNSYTWNARDQLVAISGSGLSASFSYDGLGRRSSRTINSTTTSFVYDGINTVQEQMLGAASANLLVGFGADEVFSRTDSGGPRNLLRDMLGSIIALTDSTGVVQTEYSYEPFGKTSASGATDSNTSKYTGREDDGTGLYYYRSRYYSATLQRFISSDPLGLGGGDTNLYSYVTDDPIRFLDPWGLLKVYIWKPDKDHWGHASIKLDDGTYISYMPSREMSPKAPLNHCEARIPDYDNDKKEEGGREPIVISIDGLNEDTIKQWWGAGPRDHGGWGSFNNCSDIVLSALQAGGADVGSSLINTPEGVLYRINDWQRRRNAPRRGSPRTPSLVPGQRGYIP